MNSSDVGKMYQEYPYLYSPNAAMRDQGLGINIANLKKFSSTLPANPTPIPKGSDSRVLMK
jgi:hypothetical protein